MPSSTILHPTDPGNGGSTTINPRSHAGIELTLVRGDLDFTWLNSDMPGFVNVHICDAHNIDNSSYQQEYGEPYWWEQIGDFSEEYSNIDPDNQPDDSDPYYVDEYRRWTHNIENVNTLDEWLNFLKEQSNDTSCYVLIIDTNVFSAEELEDFPIQLMDQYASYETTPVICFIINGKPCYAVRPDKIKTMSATTPILKVKGEAQVRIIDVNDIQDILDSLYTTGEASSIISKINNGDLQFEQTTDVP